eukprot:Seg941.3 transcript_id=Seg941.3/GoldUCD/mRNA.D3Y31 product="P2X purinoceptor 7" protein_id=Seg941.3/GoldUCD/D3Y31
MAHSSEEELFEDEIITIHRYQVQPFMFEPGGEDNTDRESEQQSTEDSSEEEEPDFNLERIGNTTWCECGNCTQMPTGRESLCCREILRVRLKADENNLVCIADNDDFKVICLNQAVVLTALYQYIEDETYLDDTETFELYRYISYRQFVRWIWHRLGKHKREILPACVVSSIRRKFPSDEYTGFKYPKIDF